MPTDIALATAPVERTATRTVAEARTYRLDSIDMVRGLVIVIMALDHVRDYFMAGAEQDPLMNPDVSAALFFTRWVTHFCAPVFVFLAGTSAGLMTARKTRSALGKFLLTRGLWLIVIEFFVITTGWTFAPQGIGQLGGGVLVIMQVIWVIGASMVVLAGAQFLERPACLVTGAAIILGHNLLDPIWPSTSPFSQSGPLWAALHSQLSYAAGPFLVVFAYPLLPWIGVMLVGFGLAGVFEEPSGRRDAQLMRYGLTVVVLFVALRAVGLYGDPNPWEMHANLTRTLIDFLNTTKYPPSLLFLLMTLGPAAVLCSCAGAIPDTVKKPLVMFGRVPFAFYVAHVYLIHGLALGLGVFQGFAASQLMTIMFLFPKGYGVGLPAVYVVWLLVVAMLYPFCRWVASIKARRRDWWLSYV